MEGSGVVMGSPDSGAVAVKVVAYHQPADLATVRQLVAQQAGEAGLETDKASALSLAVNELAVYSLRDQSGGGVVSMWATPGEVRVTVAFSTYPDRASHLRPVDDPAAEHGLLLVSAVCDHVHIREHVGGVTVHLAVDRH